MPITPVRAKGRFTRRLLSEKAFFMRRSAPGPIDVLSLPSSDGERARPLTSAILTAEDPSVAANDLYFYLHARCGAGGKAVDKLVVEFTYVLSDFTDLVDSPSTAQRPDLHVWARERCASWRGPGWKCMTGRRTGPRSSRIGGTFPAPACDARALNDVVPGGGVSDSI